MAYHEGRMLLRAPKKVTVYATVLVLYVVTMAFVAITAPQNVASGSNQPESAGTSQQETSSTPVDEGMTLSAISLREKTTPDCVQALYQLPAPLEITQYPSGIQVLEDRPQTYNIYGNSVNEQIIQLTECSPTGDYAAAASYYLNWAYGLYREDNGLCRIHEPKIGLHLNSIMPRWMPGQAAEPSVHIAWSRFYENLVKHESGHGAISRSYANTMHEELQNLPTEDCATIRSTAERHLHSRALQLQAAQNAYDAETSHGATQGAILRP